MCGAYIPPYNSNYFCTDLFDELEDDIEKFSSLGSILLMGDLTLERANILTLFVKRATRS